MVVVRIDLLPFLTEALTHFCRIGVLLHVPREYPPEVLKDTLLREDLRNPRSWFFFRSSFCNGRYYGSRFLGTMIKWRKWFLIHSIFLLIMVFLLGKVCTS